MSVVPNPETRLNCAEFAEVAARYYGAPSPACAPFVGMRCKSVTVDAYGMALQASHLRGDGWRREHDTLKWRMYEDAREMGQHAQLEVYGLFAAHIPQDAAARLNNLPARKRHGLVPDFLMRIEDEDGPATTEYLLELKCVHLTRTWYQYGARDDDNCPAAKLRARKIPREYVYKAQVADQKYCGTAVGTVGPIEQRLRSFSHVIPLVFGAYGETGGDKSGAEVLLRKLAGVGANRHWRRMKASNEKEAKGALAWLLRRRWALTAVRENARLTLDRLQYLGADTKSDERAAKGAADAPSRLKARADALEFANFGPGVHDTRPAVATRFN